METPISTKEGGLPGIGKAAFAVLGTGYHANCGNARLK
jgi:hypothetical protein